MANYKIKK